jgi:S1-C subfamily serine protease
MGWVAAVLLLAFVAFQHFRSPDRSASETPVTKATETIAAEPDYALETHQEPVEREETILEPPRAQVVDSNDGSATARMSAPSLEDIVGQTVPAVVSIDSETGTGSGFFVQPDLVVTNHHVVGGQARARVKRTTGEILSATVIKTAKKHDLALLRLDADISDFAVLPLGSIADVRVGEDVVAIGSPLGLYESTVTRGIVSAVRTVSDITMVQTDAAINPGNSGGPLINREGRVVGVNTAGSTEHQSLGFAVGVDHVKDFIEGREMRASGSEDATDRLNTATPIFEPSEGLELESKREEATKAFEAAVIECAKRADEVDILWNRWVNACYGKYTSGVAGGTSAGGVYDEWGRQWFSYGGVWEGGVATSNEGTPQCRGWFADINRLAGEIQYIMTNAEDQARRSSVYPGVRRDIRRKYRMDWEGWGR